MSVERDDPLRAGERTGDEMESRLDTLGEHIGTAKARAQDRQEEAGAGGQEPVAGDWEDESAGAHQGDDASEFDDPEAEEREEE